MRSKGQAGGRERRWVVLASAAVLPLGALEGWFGRTDSGDVYGSDAVQYLDCARAIERGDWHSALNPLWSQGYPALLALARPLFRAGRWGDWLETRSVNFAVFAFTWICFLLLLKALWRGQTWQRLEFWTAAGVFVVAQVCLDQVSRVGPDQLVAGMFFLAGTLLLKLLRQQTRRLAAAFGLVLGVGFLVKAVFLALGCAMLLVAFAALRRRMLVLPAAAVFAMVVLSYGAALSRQVGYRTLGEAGSLNYAWHVDRLAKWVHWEGGTDPADKAWPRPAIARFARWQTDPPRFGMPLHPSAMAGRAPTVYTFAEPVKATYVPYYDPAYFYQGYRHVLRWRYQVVAVGKSLGDLARVLIVSGFGLVFLLLWLGRRGFPSASWPLLACALAGIALYLPVHLEGRYLSAFLAVAALWALASARRETRWGVAASRLLLAGLGVVLLLNQAGIWQRALHGWTPRTNLEWHAGEAVAAAGLAGNQVGVISWTPSLHCDWAYLSGVQITSEIAAPADEKAFFDLPEAGRAEVLKRFKAAGAQAVLSWDKPTRGAQGWVAAGPMWMIRL